jgi:hypothetical protein
MRMCSDSARSLPSKLVAFATEKAGRAISKAETPASPSDRRSPAHAGIFHSRLVRMIYSSVFYHPRRHRRHALARHGRPEAGWGVWLKSVDRLPPDVLHRLFPGTGPATLVPGEGYLIDDDQDKSMDRIVLECGHLFVWNSAGMAPASASPMTVINGAGIIVDDDDRVLLGQEVDRANFGLG